MNKKHKVSAILLAGGVGSRMKSDIPKQYLLLNQKTIATYSFDIFLESDLIDEVIVVAEEKYHSLFHTKAHKKISFATPGKRRQDSSFNGFLAISPGIDFVCIHDAARPMLSTEILDRVLEGAISIGGAAAAIPLKFTVKKVDSQQNVCETPDRSTLWEVQTPQIMRHDLLTQGFEYANAHDITVTDDLSLLELIGHPVKLVEGSDTNIKITTQEDFLWLKSNLKPTG